MSNLVMNFGEENICWRIWRDFTSQNSVSEERRWKNTPPLTTIFLSIFWTAGCSSVKANVCYCNNTAVKSLKPKAGRVFFWWDWNNHVSLNPGNGNLLLLHEHMSPSHTRTHPPTHHHDDCLTTSWHIAGFVHAHTQSCVLSHFLMRCNEKDEMLWHLYINELRPKCLTKSFSVPRTCSRRTDSLASEVRHHPDEGRPAMNTWWVPSACRRLPVWCIIKEAEGQSVPASLRLFSQLQILM